MFHQQRFLSARGAALVAVLSAVSAAAACTRPIYITSASQSALQVDRPATRVTDTVIVVSVDGLRPDAIETFKAPTLQRLIAEGSYTLSARTILPSTTLPSHTSMLTGEPPERHGVYWNNTFEAKPGAIAIPTIFGVAP